MSQSRILPESEQSVIFNIPRIKSYSLIAIMGIESLQLNFHSEEDAIEFHEQHTPYHATFLPYLCENAMVILQPLQSRQDKLFSPPSKTISDIITALKSLYPDPTFKKYKPPKIIFEDDIEFESDTDSDSEVETSLPAWLTPPRPAITYTSLKSLKIDNLFLNSYSHSLLKEDRSTEDSAHVSKCCCNLM